MLVVAIALGQQAASPKFTPKDRELITSYYEHLIGTLAPGSLDRSPFLPEVEKQFVAGSHVPMQLASGLKRLPSQLESKLTILTGDYDRYTVGQHVVLVKISNLEIADIIKNVAPKTPAK